ncbi:hypothetical protein ACLESO_26945 [Pyxidicoccus sp. 3LG]
MKMLKMGLLGLMLGAGAAFATATVGGEETGAVLCCSSCEAALDNCLESCTDLSCQRLCVANTSGCFRTCVAIC